MIWTGDLVPHDVWKQSNENNMNIIEDTIKLVSEKLTGIQIFPAIGNHERAPVNRYFCIFSINNLPFHVSEK